MQNTSIRLTKEQSEAIAKIAAINGLKSSDIIRAAIRNYIRSAKRLKEAVL